MTLRQMKKKILQLIEEISEDESLTDDPDIAEKINSVINQVQFELARMKKISAYVKLDVTEGEVLELKSLDKFYQLKLIRAKNTSGNSVGYELIEDMAIFSEDGIADIFYFKYPTAITDETSDEYEFELSEDVLEILPYGAAADILKSDVSSNYGKVYEQRYENMLQRIDPRYSLGSITVEGGVDI